MSKAREYEERTEKLLEPMIERNGFELVDVEYVKEAGNYFLRVYLDKPGGITIDDCELISRELSDLLDKEDFIDESYILEVSSPGLGRQLKKDKDFKRSLGEEIDVKLFKAVKLLENGKEVKAKELFGILKDFNETTLFLEIEDGEVLALNRSDIAIVKLAFDF
ncbi:MAG: ribosome maturation factor RimP [Acetivibrio ethanolgignens]